MPKIKFLPSGIECEAKVGETVLDVALKNGVSIQHACGGFCACTTCHNETIEGLENVSPPDADELEMLDTLEERFKNSRLSCQSKIKGDMVVRVINED